MPPVPRLRPRFEVVVPCAPREALARLSEAFEAPDAPCTGRSVGHHLVLGVHDHEAHFWSPQLLLDVETHPRGTCLRGLFGPHPSVWSMFMACYAILGMLAAAALLFASSQWLLAQPPTALWALPPLALLTAIVYAVALQGKRLAQDQMRALRAFVDRTFAPANRAPASGSEM